MLLCAGGTGLLGVRYGLTVPITCGFVTLRALSRIRPRGGRRAWLELEDSTGSGRSAAQPGLRCAGGRSWLIAAVWMAPLRAGFCAAAAGMSCGRRGRPRLGGAVVGGEAVPGDESGHAGDITDDRGGDVLTSGASLGVHEV